MEKSCWRECAVSSTVDVLLVLVVELQIPTLAVLAATAEQCPSIMGK